MVFDQSECAQGPIYILTIIIIWLALQWTSWTKSRAVIGYLSNQDGDILPAQDYPLYPARKISPKDI